jgi:hypothetical protein
MRAHISAYLLLERRLAGLNRDLEAMEKRIDSLEHSILSTPGNQRPWKLQPSPDDTAGTA